MFYWYCRILILILILIQIHVIQIHVGIFYSLEEFLSRCWENHLDRSYRSSMFCIIWRKFRSRRRVSQMDIEINGFTNIQAPTYTVEINDGAIRLQCVLGSFTTPLIINRSQTHQWVSLLHWLIWFFLFLIYKTPVLLQHKSFKEIKSF